MAFSRLTFSAIPSATVFFCSASSSLIWGKDVAVQDQLLVTQRRCSALQGVGDRVGSPSNLLFTLFNPILFSSLRTNRGHRCRPFFPRVGPFICFAQRVQHSHNARCFRRNLLIHTLALWASQLAPVKSIEQQQLTAAPRSLRHVTVSIIDHLKVFFERRNGILRFTELV